MDNEQKANRYNSLMFKYDNLSNKISQIKGESLEMNEEQKNRIRLIERDMLLVQNEIERLTRF